MLALEYEKLAKNGSNKRNWIIGKYFNCKVDILRSVQQLEFSTAYAGIFAILINTGCDSIYLIFN